jgi:glycosyltransferase EpsJ
MPIYKVEEYLPKCIDSVLAQTYTDFELILVDDGSPDNCGAICDEYKKKDSRVTVIHKTNEGCPAARNDALDIATGKYVFFVDSDDYIEPNYLEQLHKLAEDNDAQLVFTGSYRESYANGAYQAYPMELSNATYESSISFRTNFYKYITNTSINMPWNKLYNNDIIQRERIRFKNVKFDDLIFNLTYIRNIERVIVSSIKGYHWYRLRKGNESSGIYSSPDFFQLRLYQYREYKELFKYWQIEDKNLYNAIGQYLVGRGISCMHEINANNKLTRAQKMAYYKKILDSEDMREALSYCHGLSVRKRIMTLPFHLRSPFAADLFASVMTFMQRYFPIAFLALREAEVHTPVSV